LTSRGRSLLLHVLFFFSGAAALVYQVVWERLLGLWSGSDVLSAALIVSAFLTGLGLGSLGGGSLADRLGERRCVGLFALCNLAIAAFALLSRAVFYDLVFARLATLAGSRVLVFVVSFAALLLPTLLMGVSLPLLSRAVVRGLADAPRTISRLYAVDLLGAAAGSFAASWLLLGSVGLVRTVWSGAVLSALVGLGGLVVAFATPAREDAPPSLPPSERTGDGQGPAPAPVALWSLLFFLSGFLAVALEIVWFRYFGVVTSGSAYIFGHVLGVFLLFDALGQLLGARLVERVVDPHRLFLPLQAAILLAAGSALLALSHPDLVPLGQFELGDRSVLTYGLVFGLLPVAAIGPAALLVGLSFPLVQRALQTDAGAVGRRVGLLQLANIVGNALGGLVAGMVLLRVFGTIGTLQLLSALGLAGALWAGAGPRSWRVLGPARLAAGGLAAALLAVIALLPGPAVFWPRVMNFAHSGLRFEVREDATGVSVLREDAREALMFANGIGQGHIPFRSIHFLLGVAGPLLHPEPRSVYIIGIGSGGSPYGGGILPETTRVRAVEIVGAGMPLLEAYARGPRGGPVRPIFEDPRFVLSVDDGRRELALREERFDVIEADAIRPQSARSGMLYSLEFFALVRRRLREGGLMIQWAASDRVRATFRQSFPYGLDTGILLAGSDRPVVVDRERIRSRLGLPEVAAWVAQGGADIDQVRALFTADHGTWSPASRGDAPEDLLISDLFPRDEFYLNRPWRLRP
jgi:predicted membrane-bound spermidine synthase